MPVEGTTFGSEYCKFFVKWLKYVPLIKWSFVKLWLLKIITLSDSCLISAKILYFLE